MGEAKIRKNFAKLGLLFVIILFSLASISASYSAWTDTITIQGTITTGEWYATIGDFVWDDQDPDGIQDLGEPGIPGVTVNLYKNDDTLAGSTITNASGGYLFSDLEIGYYYVKFLLPAGFAFSLQDQGSDDSVDSDADPISGQTIDIYVEANDIDLTWDAGLVECGPCDGKITQLTLRYNGANTVWVQVEQKKPKVMIFEDYVSPGEDFTFVGADKKGTMSTEIKIFVDGVEHVKIHTSCSQPIYPGMIAESFQIVAGWSRNGGPLCPDCCSP